jgi:hypothetical protein
MVHRSCVSNAAASESNSQGLRLSHRRRGSSPARQSASTAWIFPTPASLAWSIKATLILRRPFRTDRSCVPSRGSSSASGPNLARKHRSRDSPSTGATHPKRRGSTNQTLYPSSRESPSRAKRGRGLADGRWIHFPVIPRWSSQPRSPIVQPIRFPWRPKAPGSCPTRADHCFSPSVSTSLGRVLSRSRIAAGSSTGAAVIRRPAHQRRKERLQISTSGSSGKD